uniref:Uncharacterized protein n=1 Tax=Oryza rufipogon TaxID=4529 RepID=A0A0E0QLY7_ORYRU
MGPDYKLVQDESSAEGEAWVLLEVAKRAARPGTARARVRHGPFRHGPCSEKKCHPDCRMGCKISLPQVIWDHFGYVRRAVFRLYAHTCCELSWDILDTLARKGTSNSPGPNDKPTINADAIIFTTDVVIDALFRLLEL